MKCQYHSPAAMDFLKTALAVRKAIKDVGAAIELHHNRLSNNDFISLCAATTKSATCEYLFNITNTNIEYFLLHSCHTSVADNQNMTSQNPTPNSTCHYLLPHSPEGWLLVRILHVDVCWTRRPPQVEVYDERSRRGLPVHPQPEKCLFRQRCGIRRLAITACLQGWFQW